MKTIVIGDIHGKDDWKWIIENEEYDKLIFLGDYFDSHNPNLSFNYQIFNFNEIVNLKRKDFNKYILLIGNHDFHYFPHISYIETYSGYQSSGSNYIKNAINIALDDKMLQLCHKQNNILFTHAGVSNTWAKKNNINETEDSINDLLYTNKNVHATTILVSGMHSYLHKVLILVILEMTLHNLLYG